MLNRTLVFVDTSYLLASFYNTWETGAQAQLEIDLPEVVNILATMIEGQLDQKIQRQYWYDGIRETGPHRYQRALRTCDGVQLRTGQLIEWGDRRTQKGVDTRLVADIVVSSMKGQVSDIVLVSGDADMIPGVEEAVLNGVRVHLYGFGWDSMSSALRHACDTTTILDPREDFADAMEIQVLEGPIPPQVREAHEDSPEPDAKPAADCPEDQEGNADQPAAPSAAADIDEPSEVEATFTPIPKEPPAPAPASPAPAPRDNPKAETPDSGAASTTAKTPAPANVQATGEDAAPQPAKQEDCAENAVASEQATGDAPDQQSSADPRDTAAPKEQPEQAQDTREAAAEEPKPAPRPTPPKPSMMAPRRKLRSRYVPLPEEVWTTAGFQTPFDVGQQYASWWFENAASTEQRDQAHLLSGGGLPPEIDRPLLQFACETLHEYTLTEVQRVSLRDGFHSGIRGVLINLDD
ncbi:hypothetical protein CPHO_11800 [Corynebacterium phocae]|uniref:NYN domain-containing protein n=1 Tax=Corynebacterium phocae TaxID=161895 RepID=A0A1L7D5R8_9CORY|nr:NYN domain-containing protein [Corynebacterium phocae]APT93460.1 hypothetical protein CPHO_11800 [Corynebacterium phocae]KAA8721020.1 NYN domain-containing protein [Corynebacterium phocae]